MFAGSGFSADELDDPPRTGASKPLFPNIPEGGPKPTVVTPPAGPGTTSDEDGAAGVDVVVVVFDEEEEELDLAACGCCCPVTALLAIFRVSLDFSRRI